MLQGLKDKRRIILNLIILIAVFLFPFYYQILYAIPHFCLFQQLLSINCPGCGMLRSFHALASLDITSAIKYNPLSIVIILFIMGEIVIRVASLNKLIEPAKTFLYSYNSNKIFTCLLLMNWLLVINNN